MSKPAQKIRKIKVPRINFKLLLLYFALVIIATAIVFFARTNRSSFCPVHPGSSLIINGYEIPVEIADTDAKRQQGLSGRETLAENEGMLFVFTQVGNYGFWMKEMKFDLDFVFINGGKVVDLVENIPFPKDNQPPQSVSSKARFDQVLEINSGTIAKYNIKIGNSVELRKQ